MKITSDKLEINNKEAIPWEDVETMRLLNNKLALILTDDRVIEFDNLHPGTIDSAFRAYEFYLKQHPEKKQGKRKRLS